MIPGPHPLLTDVMLSRERLLALIPVGTTLILWGVIFATLPAARQNFPLNDDWAYSKGAFAFYRGEGVHYFRQPSMPLLGQWLLACPIVHFAGESHAALRILTIMLSLLGILAYYDLLRRESGHPPELAGFAATTLAMNPIYFVMSGTFMSDVPAFALSLMALASYTRALRDYRLGWLAAATALATLAAIDRQNTLVTPVVAGFLVWRRRTLRWNPIWLTAVLLPLTAGVVVNSWFAGRLDTVPLAPSFPTVRGVFVLVFAGSLYLGLSSLPLFLLRPGLASGRWFLVFYTAMQAGVVVCILFGRDLFPAHAYHGGFFPYLENTVTPWGTLESGNYVVGERPRMLGIGVQALLSAAGCLGGAALADRALVRFRAGAISPLSLYSGLHALLLLVSPTLYDRYLIVLMPGALALATKVPFRLRWPAGLCSLALTASFSVGLMHDWLAWNSARWELGRRALARGIPVDEIEGGLEWDSWHAQVGVATESSGPSRRGLMLPFNRIRFPHLTGRYALAFSRPKGTDVLDSQPYRLWLVPGARRFLLIKHRGEDEE